jgi:16S rRNA (adenine1518-N6/adenine1519-N6)-dimethyltransferase
MRQRICAAIAPAPSETILEIGPGRGEITAILARSGARVYAVEIDPELCSHLKSALKDFPNVKIIHSDILTFDLKSLKPARRLKVFGNIPYYITTPIIQHLLEQRGLISKVFLTVQKEYGSRLMAVPGGKKFGSLSCFAQYYSRPVSLFDIKAGSFFPRPKVDSTFLKLEILSDPSVDVRDEERFFAIIRTAFAGRRKMLTNTLKGLIAPAKICAYLTQAGISPKARPEELSLSNFAQLSKLK